MLDSTQNIYSTREVAWYGFRWVFSLFLMELMTHLFYYNAFAISGVWKQLSPLDIFIIGYGVLNFMWLKFFLIWRYFRFWSLINGIVAPENMPRCVNNCYNLDSFWKNWHASFNKWLVRYVYIPFGGSQKKMLNVWVIFTFVAVWHDLEWKLMSWAWLTCIFFIPELLVKSAASALQVEGAFGEFFFRELRAVAGAITITCLMVANLVGFVIGPSGINWLVSVFFQREGLSIVPLMIDNAAEISHFTSFAGLPILGGLLFSFYVGTNLCFTFLMLNKGRTRLNDTFRHVSDNPNFFHLYERVVSSSAAVTGICFSYSRRVLVVEALKKYRLQALRHATL
ncbi:hypothetical protein OROHE_007677 [Orobanche hederae]